MELSQEFLIDMALNVAGYVFAGLFSVVVYTMFRRRPKAKACVEPTPVTIDESEQPAQEMTPVESRRIEFVKLGGRQTTPSSRVKGFHEAETEMNPERRNRAETIRVARTMLKAGASQEKIKRLLPISDAELSLLTMSKS